MGEEGNASTPRGVLEDRFELLSQLGRGGMGVVYRALDRERGVQVALKTLRSVRPDQVLRFKAEFRALRDLRHPNLVELGELFESDGTWFFTMELLEGVNFVEYVRGVLPAVDPSTSAASLDGPATVMSVPKAIAQRELPTQDVRVPRLPRPQCDEDRLRHALSGLAKGLAALHGEGKVHRDIKPSNMIVSRSGRLVLLDFGVVAELTASRTFEEDRMVGTVSYMAPEQTSGANVGPEADWYAVGVLMFVALTGQLPFGGAPDEVLLRKRQLNAPAPSELVDGISGDLDRLCIDLLSRNPGDRPSEESVFDTLGVDRASDSIVWAPPATEGRLFVGREEELDALEDAFENSRTGSVCVFLEGESGVGKSATVDHFVELQRADEPHLVVLRGRCHERERVPYNAFDGIVDDLARYLLGRRDSKVDRVVPDEVGSLLQLFPALRAIPVFADRAAVSPSRSADVRGDAFAALRQLLGLVADRRPLLLVIDDAQWADTDSVAVLEEILHGPDSPSLCLVATQRAGEGAPTSETIEGVAEEFRRIVLRGLTSEESAELVQRLVRTAPDSVLSDATQIATEARGHPMFICELVHHAKDRGDSTDPVRLDEAIWARAQRLDDTARELLQTVCVAGAPMAQAVAFKAAGLAAQDAAAHVAALQAGSFVRVAGARVQDEIEPYHTRVREAVYVNLPLPLRRELHGIVAAALEGAGAAPGSLFRHFEAAGDAERANHYVAAAAQAAFDAMAFGRAVELYRRAVEGAGDGERRAELLEALAQSLASDGCAAEAGDVFLEAAELVVDPARKFDLQRRAAERFLMSGHMQRGLETTRAVLRHVGMSLPSSTARTIAGILWSQLRLRSHSLTWKRRTVSEPGAVKADVCLSLAGGFSMVDLLLGAYYGAKGPLLALKHGNSLQVARALTNGAISAGLMGRRAQAERLLRAAEVAVEEDGTQLSSAYLAHARMTMLFVLDNAWGKCLETTREVEPKLLAAGLGHGWEADVNTHFACASLQLTGQYSELAQRVRRHVREAQRTGNLFLEVSLRVRFVARYLLIGRCDLAHDDLYDALDAWLPETDSFGNQRTWALWSKTRIALCSGELEDYPELEEEWRLMHRSLIGRVKLLRIEWYHAYGAFLLGKALAAKRRGEASEHRRLCSKALSYAEALSKMSYPAAPATEWLLRAGVSWTRGDKDRALADTRRALDESIACGTFAYVLGIRRRLGELVGGSEGEALIAEAEADAARNGITALKMFCECGIPTGDPG